MEQADRIGFVKMLEIAVAKPLEYKKALNIRKRTLVCFVILVTMITTFIGSALPLLSFGISIGGPKHFITETLPAFEYKDGTFHIDQRIEIVQDGVRVIADSDVEEFKKSDLDDDTMIELLVSKNNLYLKNAAVSQVINIKFSDVGKGTFNNQDMLELLPLFYLGLLFGVIMVYFANILGYLISALIFALFGQSFCKKLNKQFSFKQCYVFALMAKTLVCIINNMGVAADIAFLQSTIWIFISFAIILAYLYMGIRGPKLNRDMNF